MNSPLPTAESFSQLVPDAEILKNLAAAGITVPTPIQSAVIPQAVAGRDVIAQAQTGSGKTLAFVLPLALKFRDESPSDRSTRALLITPTRELANQIAAVLNLVFPEVEAVCVIGGASIKKQVSALKRDARIVVGTPGRVLDLIKQREIMLQNCHYFVLDEADEMLSLGFIEEVTEILSKLPKERQGMFISATISPRVTMLAQRYLLEPVSIAVESETGSAPEIEHLYLQVGSELTAKVKALTTIIEQRKPRSTIVFCNTKSDTEFVEVYLRRRNYDAMKLNSDLAQKDRDRIMNLIRADGLKILIATDIAARGIDISQIDLVINYSIHDQSETYIHRTGRTGRAGRSGCAISLIGPQDGSAFHLLKKAVDFEIKPIVLDVTEPTAVA